MRSLSEGESLLLSDALEAHARRTHGLMVDDTVTFGEYKVQITGFADDGGMQMKLISVPDQNNIAQLFHLQPLVDGS